MDTNRKSEQIPTIEELQVDALRWTAREIEITEELKLVHDRRMIALGALGDRQKCTQEARAQQMRDEISTKIKQGIETATEEQAGKT